MILIQIKKTFITQYMSSYQITDILSDWGEIQIADVQEIF